MFDRLAAKKKMFQEMGEFAGEESANEMRSKYAPPPTAAEDSEPVPGTDEIEGTEGADGVAAMPEDLDALLAQLTPEQLEALLSDKEELLK